METEWKYDELATAYLNRPDYAEEAISGVLDMVGANTRDVCVADVGAGVAHLTLHLARRKLRVIAIEPSDAMRQIGIERTKSFQNVVWQEGTGEETGLASDSCDLVTFGSSFNVTDRPKSLSESHRLLKKGGALIVMWNHRDLMDEIQRGVENIIKAEVPDYDYGSRREDQTRVIAESGLFQNPVKVESSVNHRQNVSEVVTAWRSHATLQRQAGDRFDNLIYLIEKFLRSGGREFIDTPYTTRIWVAKCK